MKGLGGNLAISRVMATVCQHITETAHEFLSVILKKQKVKSDLRCGDFKRTKTTYSTELK